MCANDFSIVQDKRDPQNIVGVVPGRAAARGAVHGRPDPGERRAHHRRGRAGGHRARALRAGARPLARQRPRAARDRLHQHIQVCNSPLALHDKRHPQRAIVLLKGHRKKHKIMSLLFLLINFLKG
jgi:hypothetical protein